MRVVEIIESKRWVNSQTGRMASVYGAVPWTSAADKPNWTVETVGYTWRCKDGTVGLGRCPVSTYAEAQEVMERVNQAYTYACKALRGDT